MKVLLDENLPHELRPLLMPVHDVFTVGYMRWAGVANGKLLALAAENGFDVLVTLDRGYEHQQNLGHLPCSVVLLLAASNKIDDVRPFVAALLITLARLTAGSFVKLLP